MIKILAFLYDTFLWPIVKKVYTYKSNQIPKFEVDNKHIKNAKLLTTREELLTHLPSQGVVAELGVDCGDFSRKILNINKPKKLHLVDSWDTKRYNHYKKEYVVERFYPEILRKEVEINIGLSTDMVFEDNYFDWIYIDTAHSYKTTKAELETYHKRIKKGGIIAGHDYTSGNWIGMYRYGVIEAVHEFCVKYDWEIIYLTTELKTHPSFALRRI